MPQESLPLKAIDTLDDVRTGLGKLIALDPELRTIADAAGDLPLRRSPADFEGLARIVVGQQVSVASAAAIFTRLQALVQPLDAATIAAFSDADLAGAGLSRPKIRTLRDICSACEAGLDLSALAGIDPDEAHAALCAIRGIGPWTADIFLLFCAGHPDVFPSGDLALKIAVAEGLALQHRPTPKELDKIASAWSPYRGVAARLFWAYYRALKDGREVFPI